MTIIMDQKKAMTIREKFEADLLAMTPDNMPSQDLKDFAGLFGIPETLRLVREFGGSHFYISKISGFKKQIESFIKENFNGRNSRELAQVCECSTRVINKIVRKSSETKEKK